MSRPLAAALFLGLIGSAAALPHARGACEGGAYVVMRGDTLYSIARRHNTGYETLMKLNRFSAKTVLQPGMKVKLP